ncbi:ABC transporter ATP-binding protein/permease [Allohahella sp. A8]|uniref:ABC transporter ATP-binding protein/permease n=1 Tax=Allohahella sp. A8 TaxID=3141461 RepID=UPI000C0AEB41|nr:ABC transporter ATP-binding protein [Hahellaceae bacterium]|tara:strand:+ start:155213 stop:156967 length:1755 start_codon:yes stop_codon:yes gene_type:complete
MQTLRNFWRLARPFWTSRKRGPALWALILTILCNLGLVGVAVLTNFWNLYFYNALQDLDYNAFLLGGLQFVGLEVALAALTMGAFHFQEKLSIIWRRWETENTLQQWLHRKRFYKLQLTSPETDNPDQRIADDIRLFISISLKLGLGMMTAITSLFSFAHILWAASSIVTFTLDGKEIFIPGLLLWAALLYSLIGTGLVFWLGRKLPGLNFTQQRREADFRFSMMRLREQSEAVALYQGEAEEHQRFSHRLNRALSNYWTLVRHKKAVLGFSSFYMRSATVVGMFLMAPKFFAGAVPLGRLTQVGSAFGQVQESTSYLIGVFPEIAEWKSVIDRLEGFKRRLCEVDAHSTGELLHQGGSLSLKDLEVWLPDGRHLLKPLNLDLHAGERLLIRGPSGCGKSTLLRAFTGLWPHTSGSTSYDRESALVLSQRPYLPLGSLRQVLYYPHPEKTDDSALADVLRACQLEHLQNQLDVHADWEQTLSVGEQQRCAFARALLSKPRVLLMDESSSALDEASEAQLYAQLADWMPLSVIVSIGHRQTLERFHTHVLEISREGQWKKWRTEQQSETMSTKFAPATNFEPEYS